MIDRRFEVIEKDENQELSKILACAEQHLTCVEFGRKLLYMASQGRADQSFLLARAEVYYGLQSQYYSVIAGEHIRKRTQQRTWIQPGMVVEVAVGWLNSLLGPEIVEHQAEWDSTDKCMVPKSGDWCATAIVDEKHGFTLVLEAGLSWIGTGPSPKTLAAAGLFAASKKSPDGLFFCAQFSDLSASISASLS